MKKSIAKFVSFSGVFQFRDWEIVSILLITNITMNLAVHRARARPVSRAKFPKNVLHGVGLSRRHLLQPV